MMTFGLNDPAFIGDVPASGGDFLFPARGPFSASNYFNADSVPASNSWPRSMACWVNVASVESSQWVIGLARRDRTYDYFGLEITSGGLLRGIIQRSGSNVVTSGVSLPLNQWHHVGLVISATAMELYLGGVLIDNVSHSQGNISTWRYCVGGRSAGTNTNYGASPLNGRIADAAWWGTRDTTVDEFAAMASGMSAVEARSSGLLEHLTLSSPLANTNTGGSWLEVGNVP